MDPTLELTVVKSSFSSFTRTTSTLEEGDTLASRLKFISLPTQRRKKLETLNSDYSSSHGKAIVPSDLLVDILDMGSSHPGFTFKEIPNNFKYPLSLVLSNIDAVFNFSDHVGGLLAMQTPGNFVWLCLGADPDSNQHFGLVEYLNFRKPENYANIYFDIDQLDKNHSTYLSKDQSPWSKEMKKRYPTRGYFYQKAILNQEANINMDTAVMITNKSLDSQQGHGNRLNNTLANISDSDISKSLTDREKLVLLATNSATKGLDLVISIPSPKKAKISEMINKKISDLLTSLQVLGNGKTYIWSIKPRLVKASIVRQLVYLTSLSFKSISMFLPVSDDKVWIMGEGKETDNKKVIQILKNALKYGSETPARHSKHGNTITSIIMEHEIMSEYLEWYSRISNDILEAAKLRSTDKKNYNSSKVGIIWNIPGMSALKSKVSIISKIAFNEMRNPNTDEKLKMSIEELSAIQRQKSSTSRLVILDQPSITADNLLEISGSFVIES